MKQHRDAPAQAASCKRVGNGRLLSFQPLAHLRLPVAVLVALLLAAMLLWHWREAMSRFPPPAEHAESAELPFTQFDHPFHFYYSQWTRQVFARRHVFWGYDPTFMAGYAKTLIFPTSSTLAELVAVMWPAAGAAGYRWFVATTILLTPLILAGAAWSLTRRRSCPALALAMGVAWVWFSWPSTYATWGMGPFIVASAASLWAAFLLTDWWDHGRRRSLVCGGLLSSLSLIAHPSCVVILAVTALPGYLCCIRRLSGRAHLATWCVPLAAAAAWSPWWLPALLLHDTLGSTASGFINPNVGGRLLELLRAKFPFETALLVSGLAGLGLPSRVGRAGRTALIAGAIGLFTLGYLAGSIPAAWFLQPGRYTQPLYALLIVQTAVSWSELPALVKRASARPRRGAGVEHRMPATYRPRTWRAIWLPPGLVSVALMLLAGWRYWSAPPPPLRATLTPEITALAKWLKSNTDDSGRVLFEDRGRLTDPNRPPLAPYDPFAGLNPSALLPLLAPGQYIGGPYLYTHLKANFTQVGDGLFFGHDVYQVDERQFRRYARLYNIRWAVLWSVPLVQLAEESGGFFRPLATFGPLSVFELEREGNWAIEGTARVRAGPDRLEVHRATAGPSGRLILSYHWVQTLRSRVRLYPVLVMDDPVPFIAVDNPPPEFIIENRLW